MPQATKAVATCPKCGANVLVDSRAIKARCDKCGSVLPVTRDRKIEGERCA